jgi:hypothetical protein
MDFKIGDRVRFLNEVGGGIVSKIINRSMVGIMVEEGFEIPVMSNELIKIEPQTAAERMFDKEISVDFSGNAGMAEEIQEERNTKLSNYLSPKKFDKGIYLAFAPHDQRWLLTGMIDLFFINHTSYDVLYSLIVKTSHNEFISADYGSAEPNSKVLIQQIKREELESWSKGLLQVLFHPNEGMQPLLPLNEEFSVKMTRMISEDSYIHSSFIPEKAIVIPLGLGLPMTTYTKQEASKPTPVKAIQKEYFIDRHLIDSDTAEVDLHIEKLCENDIPPEDGAKLKLQFDYYIKCLESAWDKRLPKVIFIHGVGSGVLKSLIRGDLKQYSELTFTEAPYDKYGYGALEVRIKQ